MKKTKKFLSVLISLTVVIGIFVFAQMASAAEVTSNFNVKLGANGVNQTILTGAKDDANKAYSSISLTGGTVNQIYAWVVDSKSNMVSKYKYKLTVGQSDNLLYKDGTTVAKDATISIRIEQHNVLSKTAIGNANLH